MNPSDFIKRYAPAGLYHFTDRTNLESILEHGILSHREIALRGIKVSCYVTGNESRKLDEARGLDKYVHLCFTDKHPMAYRVQRKERITDIVWIRLNPEILLCSGVMGCVGIANKRNSKIYSIEKALELIDLESIFPTNHTSWTAVDIEARKAEVMVENCIPKNYIEKVL